MHGLPAIDDREPRALRIGRWLVDARADELRADGSVVKLEPLKMRLLLALAARPGEVVLTQELLDTVWRGVIVAPHSVYQGIAQLRRMLGDETLIETVPRKGYRLKAAVSHGVPDAPPPEPAPTVNNAAEPMTLPRRRWLGVVTTGALAAAGGAGLLWWPRAHRSPALPWRVAVLPFAAAAARRTDEAIAEGLALDVIGVLEKHPQIRPMAAASALAVPTGAPAASLRAAGFDACVTGTWRVDGLQAQLDLAWQWADDRPGGTLRVVRELAALSSLPSAIADALCARLSLAAPAAQPARRLATYALALQGEQALRLPGGDGLAAARDAFERGLELEPDAARHHAGLGWCAWRDTPDPDAPRPAEQRARAAAHHARALAVDPSQLSALLGRASIARAEGRHADARADALRALAAAPQHAPAHLALGWSWQDDGWPARALDAFRPAMALDPLDLAPHGAAGQAAVLAGRLDEAHAAFTREQALDAEHANAWWGLGLVGYARGALDEAVPAYREAIARQPHRLYLWNELAWFYLDLGLIDDADAAFARTERMLPASRWPALDRAYAWVARADRGAAPAALAVDGGALENVYPVDRLLLRAMAGLPVDAGALEQALATMPGGAATLRLAPHHVFMGHSSLLDVAALWQVLGRADRLAACLAEADAQLDRLAAQGHAMHALAFHRARRHALAGDRPAALAALRTAVAQGSRRGWWLRIDPAWKALRGDTDFKAVLAEIERDTRRQRDRLAAGCAGAGCNGTPDRTVGRS